MQASEVRDLDGADILARIESTRQEMFNLRLALNTGSLENPGQINVLRRDIARMLTILRERELAAAYVQTADNQPTSGKRQTRQEIASTARHNMRRLPAAVRADMADAAQIQPVSALPAEVPAIDTPTSTLPEELNQNAE